jgi:hypothetical protein
MLLKRISERLLLSLEPKGRLNLPDAGRSRVVVKLSGSGILAAAPAQLCPACHLLTLAALAGPASSPPALALPMLHKCTLVTVTVTHT